MSWTYIDGEDSQTKCAITLAITDISLVDLEESCERNLSEVSKLPTEHPRRWRTSAEASANRSGIADKERIAKSVGSNHSETFISVSDAQRTSANLGQPAGTSANLSEPQRTLANLSGPQRKPSATPSEP